MYALFKKEINGFFSSVSGYIVIIVFLIANGLFLWVFPGDLNVFDSGYASLDTMFLISPWVFLFLVPAVTMRLFSDERRTGTIELLLTRPITDLKIVLAKYFAGLVLVIVSLIPTLVYFVSVYKLGNPVGDIDTGGTWGSFIGLFFLASVYAAIGIFASSTTDNQIVAFIIAMLLSFFLYIGFESISSLSLFGNHEGFIASLGINDHYKSMSRGVIDTRDIVYFIAVISIFVILTKLKLQSRKW
jgi:ABC-2 type transport system permease protein